RDVYDHLLRISEQIDTYRDLLTGALDVYLSVVSNRMNVEMKRLTVVATIFLPLTFITGFFGQNFGWLVRNITSLEVFILWGPVACVTAAIGLWLWFRRAGITG
ncbi:MAG TPA: CorA family divalent cation transporter, partial [Solirubrobacteraceae bacterium]